MNNDYNLIIDRLFNEVSDNYNILLLIQNEIDILDNFSHIIKKKNINIYIIITDKYIHNKLLENIKGEECESNINIINDLSEIKDIIFDIINIFHLLSIDYLDNIMNNIKIMINTNTLIYIYCSLSNENIKKINFKNYLRNKIKNYTKNIFGILLPLTNVIENIEQNNFTINSLKIYKSNNYIIYGDNNVYEIKCVYIF